MVLGSTIVIGLIIYALIETVASLLLSGTLILAVSLFDATQFNIFTGGNILAKIESLVSINSVGINLMAIFNAIAQGIILISIAVKVLRMIISSVGSGPAEEPVQIIIDIVVTYLIMAFFFGSGVGLTNTSSGLIGTLGNIGGQLLSQLKNATTFDAIDLITGQGIKIFASINPAETIVVLLLTMAMMSGVLTASITHIERCISFFLYFLFGPICVAFYINKDTRQITWQWLLGMIAQILTIFISLVIFAVFINTFKSIPSYMTTSLDGAFGTRVSDIVFKYAMCVALLSIVTNSEKILNAIGLRTIVGGDSARALGAGLANTMTMLSLARTAKGAGRALGKAGESLKEFAAKPGQGKGVGTVPNPTDNKAPAGQVIAGQTLAAGMGGNNPNPNNSGIPGGVSTGRNESATHAHDNNDVLLSDMKPYSATQDEIKGAMAPAYANNEMGSSTAKITNPETGQMLGQSARSAFGYENAATRSSADEYGNLQMMSTNSGMLEAQRSNAERYNQVATAINSTTSGSSSTVIGGSDFAMATGIDTIGGMQVKSNAVPVQVGSQTGYAFKGERKDAYGNTVGGSQGTYLWSPQKSSGYIESGNQVKLSSGNEFNGAQANTGMQVGENLTQQNPNGSGQLWQLTEPNGNVGALGYSPNSSMAELENQVYRTPD